jgi:glycosyltransferase involved in cell wall biosynthesis
VHSLEAGVCGRLVGWLASASRLTSTPILYTPQTIDIRRIRWHRLYRGIERLLANVTSTIISVNEADRQRLIGWGIPPAKILTIPNGIDLSAMQAPMEPHMAQKSLNLDPDRPVVMQVARLSAQKNPLAFVDGAALVIRQRPATQFVMVGQGPLGDAVASRIQTLGLQEHIRLAGWRDQAYRLMTAADVITLTSRWEGSPYSLLEAMAARRPVVATAVNGCPEIIADGESGFLAPPGDVPAWAHRVLSLLDRPQLAKEMGERARQRVERMFPIQVTTARTIQLYRRLVQEHRLTRKTG